MVGLLMVTAAGMTVLGWIAGMVTLRHSLRWCGRCGRILRCPDCAWPVMRS